MTSKSGEILNVSAGAARSDPGLYAVSPQGDLSHKPSSRLPLGLRVQKFPGIYSNLSGNLLKNFFQLYI